MAVGLCWEGAHAQIYKLEQTPAPANRSLHMLYTYYIYSAADAPEGNNGDEPFVKFHGLTSHSSSPSRTDEQLKDYYSMQLSLMKYEDFWSLINPERFCCRQEDVSKSLCEYPDQLLVKKMKPGQSYRDVGVYISTVRFPSSGTFNPKDVKMSVQETGVYILMVSNCGDHIDSVISGSVVVKNPYGFLPGNEYHKMPFYGWLSLVYMFLAVFWLCLSLRWWREIFNIQNCIAGVILLGGIESFIWYIFFTDWNSSGTRGNVLFVIAILSSVAKSIFSYMLALVASLGWGVTRPFMDSATVLRIKALTFTYIVLGVIREVVLSFRHSHTLPMSFVLLCLLPVSLLNGVIFYWVFTALSSLIQMLKDRRQTEKLQVFQRLWGILISALTIATGALLYQVFTLSRSIESRWTYQWFLTDGVSHILFFVVLLAMMYLWAPHKYSQRYAYSQQIDDKDDHDAECGTAVVSAVADCNFAEADDVVGDDEDSYWAATHGAASVFDDGASQAASGGDRASRSGRDPPSRLAPTPATLGALCDSGRDIGVMSRERLDEAPPEKIE